jgi:hypothetical protein
MQKNASNRLTLISVLAVMAIFLILTLLALSQGWIKLGTTVVQSAEEQLQLERRKESSDSITLVCQANYAMPFNSLDDAPKLYSQVIVAGLDYKNKVGWYQGEFSISESRKGNLVVKGNKALVSRPAMFERFGTMITGEQFTLDRTTGEFLQSLTTKEGRKLEIIKGYCGELTKAPF